MRFLLLGGTGQIGEELRALRLPEEVEVVAPTRAALDLADAIAMTRTIAAGRWSAVINAAAYTNVDRAESEESLAFAINAEAPSRLAAETARHRIPLVHISTNYVFDGRKGAPYVEADAPAPLNAYARSKYEGERGVRAANPRHVILRTSWAHSPFRKNFVRTILRLAAERDRLTVVADQRGCPTAARDIARACLHVAMRCASAPERAPYGIYHFAGAGEATWFEFARTITEMAADRTGRSPTVVPIRTHEYPTPAVRGADTRIDCTAVIRDFGLEMRPWREGVLETIDRLLPTHKGIA
jgi:dTDP-4-dehydrorhamnose reductase